MRGLTTGTSTARHDGVLARRRRTLLPKLVLLLLTVMIVRDIVVRRWSAGPSARAEVTTRLR